MIYLIPLIIISCCCYWYDYRRNRQGRLFWWILLLIYFICVAGLRYRVGIDTIAYEKFYRFLPTLAEFKPVTFVQTRFQPGFVLLAVICKTISSDVILLQFVVAAFLNIVIFRFFWQNTRNVYFGLLLYAFLLYLNLNMEVMREAIAVGFFLLAWPAFRDGRWIVYYILCTCAFFFHVSAIILFLLPLITLPWFRFFFTFGPRTLVIGGIILAISLIIGKIFFEYLQLLSLSESISERSVAYSRDELGGKHTLNIVGFIGKFFKYFFYPILALYFLKWHNKRNFEMNNYYHKLELLTVTSIYFGLISVSILIFIRYNNYLLFFPFILLSDWIFSFIVFQGKRVRLGFVAWAVLFAPLFLNFYVTYYLQNINKEGTLKTYMMYYPYKDAISKEMDPMREKAIQYVH